MRRNLLSASLGLATNHWDLPIYQVDVTKSR